MRLCTSSIEGSLSEREVNRIKRTEIEKEKEERKVWKYNNRRRRRKKKVKNNITKEECRNFWKILEGEEMDREYIESTTKSEETIEETMEDSKYTGEKDLKDEEINRAMNKMKIKKTRGMDKLSIEVWKYAREGVKKGLIKIIRRVWKEDDISLH